MDVMYIDKELYMIGVEEKLAPSLIVNISLDDVAGCIIYIIII